MFSEDSLSIGHLFFDYIKMIDPHIGEGSPIFQRYSPFGLRGWNEKELVNYEENEWNGMEWNGMDWNGME